MARDLNPSRWPLVGREAELARFDAAWADRRCQGVVVFGPAGVGKTRLAQGFLSRAVANGFTPARAVASAAAATVPLGAIAHLLPTEADLSDPVTGFAEVAAALAGPERRRWALFVDDLHLLDATTAVLLRQLMDAGVVRLLGTVRTGEPATEAVDALTGLDTVIRIDLDVLDEDQTQRLVCGVLGGPVGQRTLRQLSAMSQGNVLYLRELILGAVQSGRLVKGTLWELVAEPAPATPVLAELITARLAGAAPETEPALESLALCEPLGLADLEQIVPLATLTELESAGLIQVVTAQRRTTVQLAHPLYGEVLRARIPALRRRALLVDQAARTAAYGARRRDDVLRIATWRLAATGTADPGLLSQAATLARHAHDYEHVITLLGALPEEHHTIGTRLLLGEAFSTLHRLEEAEAVFSDACDAAGSEEERLMIIRARSLNLLMNGKKEEALAASAWAQHRVETEIGRTVVQVNEGSIRALSGEPVTGLEMLRALDDMEPHGESGQVLDAWLAGSSFKAFALACRGETSAAVAFGRETHAVHVALDEKALFQHPSAQLNVVTVGLCEAGALAEARETGLTAVSQSLAASAAVPYLWANFFTGRSEMIAGRIAQARDLCAEAAGEAHRQNVLLATRLIDSHLAACHAQLGEVPAAEQIVAASERDPVMGMFTGEERLGEAWLYAARADLAAARSVLTAAAAAARLAGHVTSEGLLLTDVARLGDPGLVAHRLAEIAAECDGELAAARASFAEALAAEDPDDLAAAVDRLEAIGADLLAAEAATSSGRRWRQRGDHRRAARATARASELLARCGPATTPLLAAGSTAAALTAREREIALLASAGRSSRDIAADLHLSVRTVDNHLQRVYTKLGVRTRRELSDVLGRVLQP